MAIDDKDKSKNDIEEVKAILKKFAIGSTQTVESAQALVKEIKKERKEEPKEDDSKKKDEETESYVGSFLKKQKAKIINEIESAISGLPIIGDVLTDVWDTFADVSSKLEEQRKSKEVEDAQKLKDAEDDRLQKLKELNEEAASNAERYGTAIATELKLLQQRNHLLDAERIVREELLKEENEANVERLYEQEKSIKDRLKLLDERNAIYERMNDEEENTGVRPEPTKEEEDVIQRVNILDTSDLIPITGDSSAAPVEVKILDEDEIINRSLDRISDELDELIAQSLEQVSDDITTASENEIDEQKKENDLTRESITQLEEAIDKSAERVSSNLEDDELINVLREEAEKSRDLQKEHAKEASKEADSRLKDQIMATLTGPILAMAPLLLPIGLAIAKVAIGVGAIWALWKYWPTIQEKLSEFTEYTLSGQLFTDLGQWWEDLTITKVMESLSNALDWLIDILLEIGANVFGLDSAKVLLEQRQAARQAQSAQQQEMPSESAAQADNVRKAAEEKRAAEEARRRQERQQEVKATTVATSNNTVTNVSVPTATPVSNKSGRTVQGAPGRGMAMGR